MINKPWTDKKKTLKHEESLENSKTLPARRSRATKVQETTEKTYQNDQNYTDIMEKGFALTQACAYDPWLKLFNAGAPQNGPTYEKDIATLSFSKHRKYVSPTAFICLPGS